MFMNININTAPIVWTSLPANTNSKGGGGGGAGGVGVDGTFQIWLYW